MCPNTVLPRGAAESFRLAWSDLIRIGRDAALAIAWKRSKWVDPGGKDALTGLSARRLRSPRASFERFRSKWGHIAVNSPRELRRRFAKAASGFKRARPSALWKP